MLDPRAGDFDVTDDADDYVAAGTGGYVNDPEIDLRARRAGTYYIAVTPTPVDAELRRPDPGRRPLPPQRLQAAPQEPRRKKKARR